MRKVTVSKMCEWYAQTVLTFRITYVHKSYQIPITSIIMTSVEEYFAPLDATVEGLGLILVPEINYLPPGTRRDSPWKWRKLIAEPFSCRSCGQASRFFRKLYHRQPLSGHRAAQKMKNVAFGKTLRPNSRPSTRLHLKQNVSLQR